MLTTSTPSSDAYCQSGFSLMELAVVLMIIGTLMSGVLVAIGNSFESGRRTNAQNQLRQIEEALYGFATSHRRFPCPADANGAEDCSLQVGFLPLILGLSGRTDTNGILLDPWGSPFLYGAHASYTTEATLVAQFGNPIGTLLRLASASDCDAANMLNSTIPAIVITRGANWATATSLDETENSDLDDCFVNTTYSEDNFDDQLIWLSPYVLFNRMVSAGRLP